MKVVVYYVGFKQEVRGGRATTRVAGNNAGENKEDPGTNMIRGTSNIHVTAQVPSDSNSGPCVNELAVREKDGQVQAYERA